MIDNLPSSVWNLNRFFFELNQLAHLYLAIGSSLFAGKRHSLSTDYIMKLLGLEICADIVVGSDMLRGISGGQKKRVTTGEMVVGPKKTLFMDEISTGLDSSTTYQIVKSTRDFVHLLQGTVLMALLQPAPETFDLFDDIILLAEGHIVYMGPGKESVKFFESLGFHLPERKGVADFLQEVTSRKDQGQYWSGRSPHSYKPVVELAAAFKSYHIGREVGRYTITMAGPTLLYAYICHSIHHGCMTPHNYGYV